jgi:hypothetical protein
MYKVEEIACRVSVEHGEIQILRLLDDHGAVGYSIYYRRADYPDPDVRVGTVLDDRVTVFGDPVQATNEALRVVRQYEKPVSIELPVEAQEAALVAGACSRCKTVGRILFQRGSFTTRQADRVLDYKPIRAYCERCRTEVEFVPIQRGVSAHLDQEMDRLRAKDKS